MRDNACSQGPQCNTERKQGCHYLTQRSSKGNETETHTDRLARSQRRAAPHIHEHISVHVHHSSPPGYHARVRSKVPEANTVELTPFLLLLYHSSSFSLLPLPPFIISQIRYEWERPRVDHLPAVEVQLSRA